jgi:hypothetical protein
MTSLSVLGTHVIRKGLGLLEAVAMIIVAVSVIMWISLWANILHLQDISAFRAALYGTIAGHLAEPMSGECSISTLAR